MLETSIDSVDMQAFADRPVGHAVVGATYLCYCVDTSLCITAVWGRPSVDDARAFARLCEVAFHPAMKPPFLSLIDVQHLEAVDGDAFTFFSGYVLDRGRDLDARVKRLAIVRPPGLVGAITAGFLPVFGRVSESRVHTAREDALAWLGRDDAASLARRLDAAIEAARRAPHVLSRLRALLAGSYRDLTLAGAARALGVSERTLQRHLAEAGTSFRDEANAARLRDAQRLLAESDRSVTAVAFEVGCASLQHLGTLFRRHLGVSPSEWRAGAIGASVAPDGASVTARSRDGS